MHMSQKQCRARYLIAPNAAERRRGLVASANAARRRDGGEWRRSQGFGRRPGLGSGTHSDIACVEAEATPRLGQAAAGFGRLRPELWELGRLRPGLWAQAASPLDYS